MATKKVIAICQSGGEFVTNKDGSLAYSGGDAYAIDIDQDTSMTDFKSELAENFGFSWETMTLKYFLPGNKKTLITISKDKDFKRMVSFSADAANVEIFVLPEEADARNVSNMPASRSSRTTASEAVVPVVSAGDIVVGDDMITNDFQIEMGMLPEESSPLPCNFVLTDEKHHIKAAQQWENAITGVDQRFNSFTEFRDALHKYSIAHGFTYKYKKNDSHRVSVKCKAQGCPWRITASRLSTTQLICIKKMNPRHTCERAVVKAGYRASRGWVGSIIKEKLKAFPDYKPKDIAEDIKREYGIQLNYSQAWRAKEIAREQLQGSYKKAYSQLPSFCEKIRETNPGSIAIFMTKEDSSFHRLFISFYASISGFRQGCRPLLFLDSADLNSKYQGVMLVATAPDAEDGIYPVAFAVVDSETEDNWVWFLENLKLALADSRTITFVADFQNGLKTALPLVFEKQHHHAYCLRHLAEKLNMDLKAQFSHEAIRFILNDFYAAAYATQPEAYYRSLENIKSISPDAYAWVIESEPLHWANALFEGERYNHMNSTFGVDFYSWVSEAHELPITQMIDELRAKLMQSIYTRQVQSREWVVTTLTPTNEVKLHKEIELARSLQVSAPHVSATHNSLFEVHGESINIVDISQCDCDCKLWRLTGLPCSHAIAVIECIQKSPYEYCSSYFTVESYRLMYAESINPVPNTTTMMMSEEPPSDGVVSVTPPPTRLTPPGRPKSKQVEPLDMVKRQLQCSNCKGLGHNKKTCKALALV
ncbi:Transposase MuDR plant [Arabidopsis suecica]|uniref:Transposase MuDR plant n=1 Tax=Arabidopsis suecica TaxID=45249 RepID=A0A8T1XZ13_ARASU|nr:Transposase MuDR plant [Arabidopsis suecica]